MEIDEDKIDDAALALMWLTLHGGDRAWKSIDWGVMDRLFEKGLIYNPANKSKSVSFTDEGLDRAEKAFKALFSRQP